MPKTWFSFDWVLWVHGVAMYYAYMVTAKQGRFLSQSQESLQIWSKVWEKCSFPPLFFSGNTPLHLAVMMGHKGEHCWNNVAANRLSLPACKSFPVTCEFVCLFDWMSFSSFIFPTFCVWIVCTYQHKICHTSLHISQQTKTSCLNKATLFFSSFLCSKTRLKTVNFPQTYWAWLLLIISLKKKTKSNHFAKERTSAADEK